MSLHLKPTDHCVQLNEFSLKFSKTHYILFPLSNLFIRNISNVHLERVHQTTFLNIIVDNKLSFKGFVGILSEKL